MRRLCYAILLLLLGIVLSVIVAWRCAIVGAKQSTSQPLPQTDVHRIWNEVMGASRSQWPIDGHRISDAGNDWYLISEEPIHTGGSFVPFSAIVRREVGWPTRCLRGEDVVHVTEFGERHELRDMIELPRQLGPITPAGGVLSYRPIWLGLILNSIIYAAAFLLLSVVAVRVRWRYRLDRSRCSSCNYPLRGLHHPEVITCPECGMAMAARLFDRPGQVLRWWMLPMILPALAWLTLWFCGVIDLARLRFDLRWDQPMLTIPSALTVFVATAWLFLILEHAYADRAAPQRHILAAIAAFALSCIAYAALYALILSWQDS